MRSVSSMIPPGGLLAGRRDSHRASAWQADAYPATLALSVSATVVPPARQRRLGERHALGIKVLPGDGTLPSSLRRARTERRARRNVKSELVAVTIRRLDVALAFRP